MDIINQILEKNKIPFISLAEIVGYTILLSLIIYHIVIYFGRRNFKESKYYLYFSYYVIGLLLYIFIDTNTYYILMRKVSMVKFTLFFTAVSFLIMYKSVILLLNDAIISNPKTKRLINKYFNIYALLNLVWLLRILAPAKVHWRIFWLCNLLTIATLAIVYLSTLRNKRKLIDISIKIIAWLTISYGIYIILYRGIWIVFPKAPRLPFWILNDILKIVVSFVFAYALARKSNKEFLELQELKDNLEEKVKEKTCELEAAKLKIENASEQRSNYFVNLAHETKTPLTLISNYLDRYVKTNGLNNDLKVIKDNFTRLKNEMTRFLDVEKYEKGQVIYEHTHSIDIAHLINHKIPLYKEEAALRGINATFKIEENIFIKADEVAIERIVNNLFENAIKYSSKEAEITVEFTKNKNTAQLKVSDTGVGIDKEKLENIFDPYYQISEPKLNKQGLGMGLYIVKSIVDSLNGKITVDSTLGEGTSFTITLPIEDKGVASNTLTVNGILPKNKTQRNGKKDIIFKKDRKNLFVVEDNDDMRNYLCEELNESFNVSCANNGKAALLKLMNSPKTDLIISDVMMDEMDGYEFFNALSHKADFADIPVIFLTARSKEDEKIEMLTKGAAEYLYKPFSIEELKAKINSVFINTEKQRQTALKDAVSAIQNQLNHKETRNGKWENFEIQKTKLELTQRQIEIVELIEKGLEYKQIADELNISVKTVHRHIQNLFEKCGVHSKMELLKVLFE